jgi:hypothetical protein
MAETLDRSTHFVFEHKVFNVQGSYFAFTADGVEPAFYVRMGEYRAALQLAALRHEFGIVPDSDDGKLLSIVEKSLRYVKEIRPGDSIPRELLDGTASWSVEEKHRVIARSRLAVQMASWLTGKESVIADEYELARLVNDPETKDRMQKATAEIAQKLGIGAARKQEVVDRVDDLGRELAYIEALRDRYGLVRAMTAKVHQLAKLYRSDRGVVQDISRVQSLLLRPNSDFENFFGQVDGATCEILPLLRKFDAQVTFIRDVRDQLHTRLLVWDELLKKWGHFDAVRGGEAEAALKDIYRFLAHNFPQRQDWRVGSY